MFCHPKNWINVLVAKEQPVTVRASSLLGWARKLVPQGKLGDSEMVVCSGEGVVFLGGNFIGGEFFGSDLFGEAVKENSE